MSECVRARGVCVSARVLVCVVLFVRNCKYKDSSLAFQIMRETRRNVSIVS